MLGFTIAPIILPKFIPIDTKSLIEIFVKKNKNHYLKDIDNTKKDLWDTYFDINVKKKNYVFDYTIITDCYSASIRFIHEDELQKEQQKKANMKKAKQEYKGLTKKEKEELKKKKKEKQKKLKKLKRIVKKIPKAKYIEFPYIDEVDKKELKGKHIFIDPGKRELLSMIDDDGKRLSYTNKQRVTETKRLKYQRLIKNYKDKLGILLIENELSQYNSKTCDINKFETYITEKNKINNKLFKLYENEKFRQYKWYGYINNKRANDNMLNIIEKRFGKNPILIHGDWSDPKKNMKQMRNYISTPNIGIKRKLKERFKVFNIDEYRTSCLHYKTEEKGDHLYFIDKNNKKRKLHSVLTFKMETTEKECDKYRLNCINRDYNGCLNMRKIFNHYMKTGERPLRYRRGYEIPKASYPVKGVKKKHAQK